MRFAQLVVVPVVQAKFDIVEEFSQLTIRFAGDLDILGFNICFSISLIF